MTFYGANAIIHAITFMVFMTITFVSFLFLYNIGIVKDPRLSGDDGIPFVQIGILIACGIIGGVCAFFARKFVIKYAVMLLGACTGGAVLFFIMA